MRGPRVGRTLLRARSLVLICSLGVAVFHQPTLPVVSIGLAAIVTDELATTALDVAAHPRHEWVVVLGETS